MERIKAIKDQAKEHKARGHYDNAMCRTGVERSIYAETWAKA